MSFRRMGAITLVLVLLLVFATTALAKTTKFGFNDVDIDGTIVEIEAGVKTTNKGDFSQCSYFSDDYADYLGQFADDVFAGDSAEKVLAFCVDNFDNRTE
jgi:hypothetical protein